MAAVAAAVVGAPTRLHRLLHHPPPSFFLKPLLISTTAVSKQPQMRRPKLISTSLPFIPPHLFCHSLPAIKASLQVEQPTQELDEEAENEDENLDSSSSSSSVLGSLDDENGGEGETEAGKLDTNDAARMNLDPSTVLKRNRVDPVDLPTLTVREKKELASYANSLGKKLKSQLVGKSGVTANVAASFVENLESNELLKVKIHGTCPEELDDTVKQLEAATGSVVVGRIGRTVILYRPSLTKLKAEEKKEQMRKIFLKRKQRYSRPSSMEFQKKGRPRMFVRDSRGRPKV
ncbi:putative RNA-binding, CRM domain-containing protein [Rosa chinensis]|uniref:Putative RNA-binding, CRM domain-containing protein n=1 Tax=Rosa chinensis TaxID=74649 RepID=A0A2P6PPV0_ROSCH|nr:uncharacterized protein LOC112174606 [Rosa chinensis]PRQ23954.1 putative RNA-binding, CRM domain-containing protein [Rosa chinensis]